MKIVHRLSRFVAPGIILRAFFLNQWLLVDDRIEPKNSFWFCIVPDCYNVESEDMCAIFQMKPSDFVHVDNIASDGDYNDHTNVPCRRCVRFCDLMRTTIRNLDLVCGFAIVIRDIGLRIKFTRDRVSAIYISYMCMNNNAVFHKTEDPWTDIDHPEVKKVIRHLELFDYRIHIDRDENAAKIFALIIFHADGLLVLE